MTGILSNCILTKTKCFYLALNTRLTAFMLIIWPNNLEIRLVLLSKFEFYPVFGLLIMALLQCVHHTIHQQQLHSIWMCSYATWAFCIHFSAYNVLWANFTNRFFVKRGYFCDLIELDGRLAIYVCAYHTFTKLCNRIVLVNCLACCCWCCCFISSQFPLHSTCIFAVVSGVCWSSVHLVLSWRLNQSSLNYLQMMDADT